MPLPGDCVCRTHRCSHAVQSSRSPVWAVSCVWVTFVIKKLELECDVVGLPTLLWSERSTFTELAVIPSRLLVHQERAVPTPVLYTAVPTGFESPVERQFEILKGLRGVRSSRILGSFFARSAPSRI